MSATELAPPPVETEAGEAMRAGAAKILTARYALLLERSKRRALTAGEKADVFALERTIGILQAMERPANSPAL